jgi:hypothetical protein
MKRINLHVPLALGAMLVGAAPVAASPATITSLSCESDDSNLATELRYRDQSTGASYVHRGTIVRTSSGHEGTTALYDSVGRLLAAGHASSTSSQPQVTFGPGWSSAVESTLQAALADPHVQNQLTTCSAPAMQRSWQFYFCPIYLFVWDEDLARQLCGWLIGGPLL